MLIKCFLANLIVVLLQVDQLLFEAFDPHLQVWAGHGEVIQDTAQPGDVRLHRLAQQQLIVIPEKKKKYN